MKQLDDYAGWTDPARIAAWKTLLGRLINDSARLRFFPHRIVMFLALAELTQDSGQRNSLLVAAEGTIDEFRYIYLGISAQHDVYGVDGDLTPWLNSMLDVHCRNFKSVTERFTADILDVIRLMKDGLNEPNSLVRIGHFVANTLFGSINPLVDAFASELTRVSEMDKLQSIQMAADRLSAQSSGVSIQELADNLVRINSTIQMISINSRIQAAHLGQQGKPFALLAGEIQHLSTEIVRLTDRIKQEAESFELRT